MHRQHLAAAVGPAPMRITGIGRSFVIDAASADGISSSTSMAGPASASASAAPSARRLLHRRDAAPANRRVHRQTAASGSGNGRRNAALRHEADRLVRPAPASTLTMCAPACISTDALRSTCSW